MSVRCGRDGCCLLCLTYNLRSLHVRLGRKHQSRPQLGAHGLRQSMACLASTRLCLPFSSDIRSVPLFASFISPVPAQALHRRTSRQERKIHAPVSARLSLTTRGLPLARAVIRVTVTMPSVRWAMQRSVFSPPTSPKVGRETQPGALHRLCFTSTCAPGARTRHGCWGVVRGAVQLPFPRHGCEQQGGVERSSGALHRLCLTTTCAPGARTRQHTFVQAQPTKRRDWEDRCARDLEGGGNCCLIDTYPTYT